MKNCPTCRYSEFGGVIEGNGLYFCYLAPPKPVTVDNKVQWVQPPMTAAGRCGQHKLAFWRWLKSFAVRAT